MHTVLPSMRGKRKEVKRREEKRITTTNNNSNNNNQNKFRFYTWNYLPFPLQMEYIILCIGKVVCNASTGSLTFTLTHEHTPKKLMCLHFAQHTGEKRKEERTKKTMNGEFTFVWTKSLQELCALAVERQEIQKSVIDLNFKRNEKKGKEKSEYRSRYQTAGYHIQPTGKLAQVICTCTCTHLKTHETLKAQEKQ